MDEGVETPSTSRVRCDSYARDVRSPRGHASWMGERPVKWRDEERVGVKTVSTPRRDAPSQEG